MSISWRVDVENGCATRSFGRGLDWFARHSKLSTAEFHSGIFDTTVLYCICYRFSRNKGGKLLVYREVDGLLPISGNTLPLYSHCWPISGDTLSLSSQILNIYISKTSTSTVDIDIKIYLYCSILITGRDRKVKNSTVLQVQEARPSMHWWCCIWFLCGTYLSTVGINHSSMLPHRCCQPPATDPTRYSCLAYVGLHTLPCAEVKGLLLIAHRRMPFVQRLRVKPRRAAECFHHLQHSKCSETQYSSMPVIAAATLPSVEKQFYKQDTPDKMLLFSFASQHNGQYTGSRKRLLHKKHKIAKKTKS